MIDVTYEINSKRYMILADGHAEEPLVCAAFSGLMYALAGFCSNKAEYFKSLKWDIKPGRAYVIAEPVKPVLRDVFDMTLLGIAQIEEGNAGNILIKKFKK